MKESKKENEEELKEFDSYSDKKVDADKLDELNAPPIVVETWKKWEKNELYNKSSALHKRWQLIYFEEYDKRLNGYQKPVLESVGGRDVPVIYYFENGLIHSPDCNTPNEKPAIETAGHWEYWEHGLIKKVVDKMGDTEEYWKDGTPYKIETNLSERRERGEEV